jgi:hypothetical protein
MAACAEYLHSHGVGHFADGGEGAAEVLFGFLDRFADSSDEFHRVQEQFALDVGVFVVFVEVRMVRRDTLKDVVRD